MFLLFLELYQKYTFKYLFEFQMRLHKNLNEGSTLGYPAY